MGGRKGGRMDGWMAKKKATYDACLECLQLSASTPSHLGSLVDAMEWFF